MANKKVRSSRQLLRRLQLRIPEKEIKRMVVAAKQAEKDFKRIRREWDRLSNLYDETMVGTEFEVQYSTSLGTLAGICCAHPYWSELMD